MPQLIAMIIVVVGAMIYMFQTFGGTGDKIEGIAQKTSIITEINNIKNGIKLAARSEDIRSSVDNTDPANPKPVSADLKTLANSSYFAEQINVQLKENSAENKNKYFAISFGGGKDATDAGMTISLVADQKGRIPGIYVDLTTGSLSSNAVFLEKQIITDLEAVAYIDAGATSASASASVINSSGTDIEKRTPALRTAVDDGKFIIYFKDFGSNEVVQ